MSNFTAFEANGKWCCFEDSEARAARERELQALAAQAAAQAAREAAARRAAMRKENPCA